MGNVNIRSKKLLKKSSRKQCILLSIEFFLARHATYHFLLFKSTRLGTIFRKRYACGCLYAADFKIFFVKVTLRYTLLKTNFQRPHFHFDTVGWLLNVTLRNFFTMYIYKAAFPRFLKFWNWWHVGDFMIILNWSDVYFVLVNYFNFGCFADTYIQDFYTKM